MKNNKIIIAEPSPIVAAGLSSFFDNMNQISVVSIVDNIDNLQNKMIVHNPELLIINPILFGYSIDKLFKQISQNFPDTISIALVSSYFDKSLLKNFDDIIELNDNKQKIINKIVNILNKNDESSVQNDSVDLSNREIDVLVCISKGMTNKDISDLLNISVHTVITHRKNIVKKTGIKSVAGLTVYALINNLVEESDINV